jgi:hypothetical protein
MYRHYAIKSDVLPRYGFPKVSEGDVSQQRLPNTATRTLSRALHRDSVRALQAFS